MLSKSIPDFAPDFSVGEYGRRKWYNFHVFNNSSRLEDEMSYDSTLFQLTLFYSHLTDEQTTVSVSKSYTNVKVYQ